VEICVCFIFVAVDGFGDDGNCNCNSNGVMFFVAFLINVIAVYSRVRFHCKIKHG
jgi:hypothetical protein